jgi:hypothetical protein
MTLNFERFLAIKNTRSFLYSLLDPKKTPKVPSSVREEARSCLKHFPEPYWLENLEEHVEGDIA